MKRRAVIILCIIFFCSSCVPSGKVQETGTSSDPMTLTVYMTGDAVYQDNEPLFFNTAYSMGENYYRRLLWGEQGHIYYQAIQEFEEKTGHTIAITYFEFPDELFLQLAKDQEAGTLPDVVIADATTNDFNTYAYMKEDYFTDLMSYLQPYQDQYYEKVLQAGRQQDKQYILPLLFNVTVGMGDKQVVQREGLAAEKDLSLKDYLEKMTAYFEGTWDRKNYEGMAQLTTPVYYSLFQMVDAASGMPLIEYDTGRPCLNKEYVEDLYAFWTAYLRQSYGEEWEAIQEEARSFNGVLPYQKSQWYYLSQAAVEADSISEVLGDFGVLIEGGGYSTMSLHSALAQAYYYHSRYQDAGREFILFGLPCYEEADAYTAEVTMFGGVTAECSHVQQAFDFLKFLADYETPWQMGLSVNRERTRQQMERLSSMEYTLYESAGYQMPQEELPSDLPYIIKPLSSEIVNEFMHIVDHIAKATLPEEEVRWILYEAMHQGILENQSSDEVYHTVQQALSSYNKEGSAHETSIESDSSHFTS